MKSEKGKRKNGSQLRGHFSLSPLPFSLFLSSMIAGPLIRPREAARPGSVRGAGISSGLWPEIRNSKSEMRKETGGNFSNFDFLISNFRAAKWVDGG